MSSTTIALDVDGVVSPVCGVYKSRPASLQDDLGWAYSYFPEIMTGTLVADDVVSAIQQLHQNPEVAIAWHTSWWNSAAEDLAPALNLPSFPMFATEAEYWHPSTSNWKLDAVVRWLRQAAPNDTLIWVDDEISNMAAGASMPEWIKQDPRLITVCPNTRIGLTPSDINFITSVAGRRAHSLAAH